MVRSGVVSKIEEETYRYICGWALSSVFIQPHKISGCPQIACMVLGHHQPRAQILPEGRLT